MSRRRKRIGPEFFGLRRGFGAGGLTLDIDNDDHDGLDDVAEGHEGPQEIRWPEGEPSDVPEHLTLDQNQRMPYHEGARQAFLEEDIAIANATCRDGGSVGKDPLVYRWLRANLSPEEAGTVLDYGAGRRARHTIALREAGYATIGWDFGRNFSAAHHDSEALQRTYDVVLASNVLNVQASQDAVRTTLAELQRLVAPGGMLIANLPAEPRKSDLDAKTLQAALESAGFTVDRVGGSKAAPLLKATKGAAIEVTAAFTNTEQVIDNLARGDFALRQQLEQAAMALLSEEPDLEEWPEAELRQRLQQEVRRRKLQERTPAGAVLEGQSGDFDVYRITTAEAARELGTTAWCITREARYFKQYTQQGVQFWFFVPKSGPPARYARAVVHMPDGNRRAETYGPDDDMQFIPVPDVHDAPGFEDVSDVGARFLADTRAFLDKGDERARSSMQNVINSDEGARALSELVARSMVTPSELRRIDEVSGVPHPYADGGYATLSERIQLEEEDEDYVHVVTDAIYLALLAQESDDPNVTRETIQHVYGEFKQAAEAMLTNPGAFDDYPEMSFLGVPGVSNADREAIRRRAVMYKGLGYAVDNARSWAGAASGQRALALLPFLGRAAEGVEVYEAKQREGTHYAKLEESDLADLRQLATDVDAQRRVLIDAMAMKQTAAPTGPVERLLRAQKFELPRSGTEHNEETVNAIAYSLNALVYAEGPATRLDPRNTALTRIDSDLERRALSYLIPEEMWPRFMDVLFAHTQAWSAEINSESWTVSPGEDRTAFQRLILWVTQNAPAHRWTDNLTTAIASNVHTIQPEMLAALGANPGALASIGKLAPHSPPVARIEKALVENGYGTTELQQEPYQETEGTRSPRFLPRQIARSKQAAKFEGFTEYYKLPDGVPVEEVIRLWQEENKKPYDRMQPYMVGVDELWPYREYDWRRGYSRGGPEEWEALKESMAKGWEEGSWITLIVGQEGGAKVGEGNHRLGVAKELGIEKVPMRYWFFNGEVEKNVVPSESEWVSYWDPEERERRRPEEKPPEPKHAPEPIRERTPEEEAQLDEILDLLGTPPRRAEFGNTLKELDRGREDGPMGPYEDWTESYDSVNAFEEQDNIHLGEVTVTAVDVSAAKPKVPRWIAPGTPIPADYAPATDVESLVSDQRWEALPADVLASYPHQSWGPEFLQWIESAEADQFLRGPKAFDFMQLLINRYGEDRIFEEGLPGVSVQAQRGRAPWVAVDLDGTILSEEPGMAARGGFGEPLPGAKEALDELKSLGWRVSIYTARFDTLGPVEAAELRDTIAEVLTSKGISFSDVWVGPKPRADWFVDNKALHFDGKWDEILLSLTQEGYAPRDESQHDHESGTGLIDTVDSGNDFGAAGDGLRRDKSIRRPPGVEEVLY